MDESAFPEKKKKKNKKEKKGGKLERVINSSIREKEEEGIVFLTTFPPSSSADIGVIGDRRKKTRVKIEINCKETERNKKSPLVLCAWPMQIQSCHDVAKGCAFVRPPGRTTHTHTHTHTRCPCMRSSTTVAQLMHADGTSQWTPLHSIGQIHAVMLCGRATVNRSRGGGCRCKRSPLCSSRKLVPAPLPPQNCIPIYIYIYI